MLDFLKSCGFDCSYLLVSHSFPPFLFYFLVHVCMDTSTCVLSNMMNLKGITNANSDMLMLPCQTVRQPAAQQTSTEKALQSRRYILVCALQCSFLMHSKHIFTTECLSGWVRKRRKNECLLRWLVCNTGCDRQRENQWGSNCTSHEKHNESDDTLWLRIIINRD